MKRISGFIGALSLAAAVALTGCQTDECHLNDTQYNNIDNTKSAKVRASDAYVVSLQSAATIKVDNQEFNTTKVEENGTVVFKGIPKDLNLSNAIVYIPKDAIVDTDGDGILSDKDQIIRMPLKAKGIDGVANPIATLALEHNDTEAYEKFKNFDPVKAKIDLIKNPDNDKIKALVAISDAVALLVKEAKGKDKNVTEVMKKIKLALVKDIADKNDTAADVQVAVIDTIDDAAQEIGISEENITKKVVDVLKVIDAAHEAVANEDTNITAHQAVAAVIAVSDADADANEVAKDIKEGMLNKIKEHIKENPIVKKHITEKGHFIGGNGFGFGMHGNGGGKHKDDEKTGTDGNTTADSNLTKDNNITDALKDDNLTESNDTGNLDSNLTDMQKHAGGMDGNNTHDEGEHNSTDEMQKHVGGMDNNFTGGRGDHNGTNNKEKDQMGGMGAMDNNMSGNKKSEENELKERNSDSNLTKNDEMQKHLGGKDDNASQNRDEIDKKEDALNPKEGFNGQENKKSETDENATNKNKDLSGAAKEQKDINETAPKAPGKNDKTEGTTGGNFNGKADNKEKAENENSNTDAEEEAEQNITAPKTPVENEKDKDASSGNLNGQADGEANAADKNNSTGAAAETEEQTDNSANAGSSADINNSTQTENGANEDLNSTESGQAIQDGNSSIENGTDQNSAAAEENGIGDHNSTEAENGNLQENNNTDTLADGKKQKMKPLTAPQA